MKNSLLLLLLIAVYLPLLGQQAPPPHAAKSTFVHSTKEHFKIDGRINEAAWFTHGVAATDFIENWPSPGTASSDKTEVFMYYDHTGLYVAAKLYDAAPDSIMKQLSIRDDLGTADWFGIFIDPYQDGINGLGFKVSASNVQLDLKFSSNSGDNDEKDASGDENWDAVWESATQVTDYGWNVEMKLPWSALRFPEKEVQQWNLNFARMNYRYQQKSYWNEVDPQVAGFFTQSGQLLGIKEIKPPVRLQATPFVAAYATHNHDPESDPNNSFGKSIGGGMDIKYGINDAFTLDMTLIPDFGEAQSDNLQLNLSPFEIRFSENRQFFTEGTELFTKGNLFYSRRVGGRPLYYWDVEDNLNENETIVENPSLSQLYNATKVSGRTEKGLGIGVFNAIAGRAHAIVENAEGERKDVLTNPMTNYNVFVLDQNLKNNSYVTLVNTNVLREGNAYDANVTGSVFQFRDAKSNWELSGKGVLSQKYLSDSTDLGHSYRLEFKKISGRFQFGLEYYIESDTYDPNDLGFLYNNNEKSTDLWINYNVYKKIWKLNAWGAGLWTSYERLYEPNVFTEYSYNAWAWTQTQSFWNFNVSTYHQPVGRINYFEAREDGRFWKDFASHNWRINIRSDKRKAFIVGFFMNYRYWEGTKGRYRHNTSIDLDYRVNDRLSVNLETSYSNWKNMVGYANHWDRDITDPVSGETSTVTDIIFGYRDELYQENVLGIQYTFTSNMSLRLRTRHYWAKVSYNEFQLLEEDGYLGSTDYEGNHDYNFNAFNVDLNFRWRFAPGSDIFITYKNAIVGGDEFPKQRYFDNFKSFNTLPQSNSISVKVIYFLDYLNLKKY